MTTTANLFQKYLLLSFGVVARDLKPNYLQLSLSVLLLSGLLSLHLPMGQFSQLLMLHP